MNVQETAGEECVSREKWREEHEKYSCDGPQIEFQEISRNLIGKDVKKFPEE